jgi:hypothetical protein
MAVLKDNVENNLLNYRYSCKCECLFSKKTFICEVDSNKEYVHFSDCPASNLHVFKHVAFQMMFFIVFSEQHNKYEETRDIMLLSKYFDDKNDDNDDRMMIRID